MLFALKRPHAALVALALVAAQSSIARADVTEQCIADAETAQKARLAGHLEEASKAAIACGRNTCPAAIANDCKSWLAQIEAVQPSIVLRATADGKDVTDVTVTLDGKVVLTSLDGRELKVDPGEHTLLFENAGHASVTQKVLIVVGERARVVDIAFTAPAADAWHVPTVSWIVGGAGIVAAGIGAGLWVSGRSDHSTLATECGNGTRVCTESDESGAKTKLVVGDVLVLAGAAAVVGAVVFAITDHAKFSAHVDGTSAGLRFSATF